MEGAGVRWHTAQDIPGSMWPVTQPDHWRSHLPSPGGSSCPKTDKKDLRVNFTRVLAMDGEHAQHPHEVDPQVILVCLGTGGTARAQQVTRSECVRSLRPQAADSVGPNGQCGGTVGQKECCQHDEV